MLWTEKYRPRKLDEIIGNDEAVGEVRKWALLWQSNKPQKPLLLVGPPGTGKTTAAYALAEDFGWEIVEMNASDERTAQRVLRMLGGASSTASLSGNRRLILVDEVDGIHGREDRGGVSAVLQILRSATNPIILTANDEWGGSAAKIRGMCKVVKYKRINYRSLANYLANILEKEGIEYEQDALLELARRESGDVRSAIFDLQAVAEENRVVDGEALKVVGFRDREVNIFEVLRKIFRSERVIPPFSLTATLDVDPSMFKAWLVENIPREYEKPEEIAEALQWASKADVFDGRIIRRQYWGFLAYSTELLVNGTIVAKKGVYRKFTPYSFPQWIKEQSKYKNCRASLRKLAGKLCPLLHVSRKIFVQDYFPLLPMIFKNREWAAHIVAAAKLDADDVSLILGKSAEGKEVKKILEDVESIRKRVLREKVCAERKGREIEEPEKEDNAKQATLFDYIRPSR